MTGRILRREGGLRCRSRAIRVRLVKDGGRGGTYPRDVTIRLCSALTLPLAVLVHAAMADAQVFTPVSVPDMAAHVAFSTGASWVDFDGDGDLDLYVVTAFSANNDNVLYRNDGGDTFVRVTGEPVVQDAAETVCSSWADVDNDGDLDAYVTALSAKGGRLYRRTGGSWILGV